MSDRGGDGAARHVESAHERAADVAVYAIALDLRDVEDVLGNVAGHVAVLALELDLARLRDGDPRERVHAGHLHALGAFGGGDLEAVGRDGVQELRGVEQAGVVGGLLVVDEQLAVVDDLLAAREDAYDLEVLGGVARDDVHVGALSGCERSDVGELEGTSGVDGDHLDGLRERHAGFKGELQMMVQMSRRGQVAAVQVVGDDAHHGGVDVLADDTFQLVREGASGRRLAQHGMDARACAVHDVVGGKPLVAGGDAGGDAFVEVFALHLDEMPLRGHTLHRGDVVKRLEQVGQLGENVGTDAFGDAHGVGALQRLADDLRVELAAARLERRREGHVRRHDEVQVEVGDLVFLKHGLDAGKPRHHTDFMKVGHDGGGAMLEHGLREGTDSQVGAFRMDMPVDEARGDEGPLGIDRARSLADAVVDVADRRDSLVANRHAAVVDLARVDVDDATARDDHVGRLGSTCNAQKFPVHALSFRVTALVF